MAKEIEPTNNINLISAGTRVNGDIESSSDIRIDGNLKGKIDIKGKVVIGSPGELHGDIKCQLVEVSGKVTGNIMASDLVSLKSSAIIQGEIITKKLAIEPGAVFTGSCKMDGHSDARQKEIQTAR